MTTLRRFKRFRMLYCSCNDVTIQRAIGRFKLVRRQGIRELDGQSHSTVQAYESHSLNDSAWGIDEPTPALQVAVLFIKRVRGLTCMLRVFLVGSGGFLGTILRYAVGGWVHDLLDNTSFPYGTLVVNAAGCLLIGLLSELRKVVPYSALRPDYFFLSACLGDSRPSPRLHTKPSRSPAILKIWLPLLT